MIWFLLRSPIIRILRPTKMKARSYFCSFNGAEFAEIIMFCVLRDSQCLGVEQQNSCAAGVSLLSETILFLMKCILNNIETRSTMMMVQPSSFFGHVIATVINS